MAKKTNPNPHPAKLQNALIKAQTDMVMAEDEGRKKHLTDDQVQYALDRLADGDTMLNVTKHLNVSRASFWRKGIENPEFHDLLMRAIQIGMMTRVEKAENAAYGGEMSTGSVERDRLVIDFTKWMASRLNRRMFGDKIEIDQRQITIHVNRDDDDVC